MPSPELEEFAKLLVQQVRDQAIRSCDRTLRADARSPVGMRWREAAKGKTGTPPEVVVPDCVDETIFYLLQALDQGMLQLQFVASNGNEVALHEDGELSGWYMGTGGWRAQYSEERFVDDFADLDPEDG